MTKIIKPTVELIKAGAPPVDLAPGTRTRQLPYGRHNILSDNTNRSGDKSQHQCRTIRKKFYILSCTSVHFHFIIFPFKLLSCLRHRMIRDGGHGNHISSPVEYGLQSSLHGIKFRF